MKGPFPVHLFYFMIQLLFKGEVKEEKKVGRQEILRRNLII